MGTMRLWSVVGLGLVMGGSVWVDAQAKTDKDKKPEQQLVVTGTAVVPPAVVPADSTTEGTVTVGGQTIA